MELGVFSRTYEISDLEETYNRMTSQGIYHTQLNLSNAGMPIFPNDINEKRIDDIKRLSNQYRITLDALTGTFNMIDPEEAARKKGCAQFEIQCKIARLLNIPIVSLCTGSKNPESKWKWHDDNKKQSSWDDLMRTTYQILKYAEDNHIVLGIETEASNIINTPEKARRYLDAIGSDHIKIIMDGANLFRSEQGSEMEKVLQGAFDLLGKDIALAHAKDVYFHGGMEFAAVGEGELDFKYYISLLNQVGYQGPLIMHGLSEAQIPSSLKFLKEIMTNA